MKNCKTIAPSIANFRHTIWAKRGIRHDASRRPNPLGVAVAHIFQEALVSHKTILRSILFACALIASPCFAQNNPAPQSPPPAANNAPSNSSALTPDQARRALDTLQDDAKRAQMIDTLRALAAVAPVNANAAPAIAAAAAPAAPPPAPEA